MSRAKRNAGALRLRSVWDEGLLLQFLRENGIKETHATNLWNWLVRHINTDAHIESLTQVPWRHLCVPKAAEQLIIDNFELWVCDVVERHDSARKDTTKLLLQLQDGHRIETVVMKHANRATVCVSSQIGCKMGCKFCATGTMGIIGNLTAGEIVEQLVHATTVCRIRNVVFMGMGEPLNNYAALLSSISAMTDVRRFGLSPSHITVSTVGVVPRIYDMTRDIPSVNLALSLHAPNQELRCQLVPTATAYPIDKLIGALKNHMDHCKRSSTNNNRAVMIEYILIHRLNDTPSLAHELGHLLGPMCEAILLNLIPYNPTEVAEDYRAPTWEDVYEFQRICVTYGLYTKVRRDMGQDIAGACGQLALAQPTPTSDGLVQDIEDIVNHNSGAVSVVKPDLTGVINRVRKSKNSNPNPNPSPNPSPKSSWARLAWLLVSPLMLLLVLTTVCVYVYVCTYPTHHTLDEHLFVSVLFPSSRYLSKCVAKYFG